MCKKLQPSNQFPLSISACVRRNIFLPLMFAPVNLDKLTRLRWRPNIQGCWTIEDCVAANPAPPLVGNKPPD